MMKQTQLYIKSTFLITSFILLFAAPVTRGADGPSNQVKVLSKEIASLLPVSVDLLNQIASHQPSSISALADLDGRVWAERQAFAQFLPSIEASLSHGLDRTISKSTTLTSQSAGVDASVNLFAFGADTRTLQRAKIQRRIFQLEADKVINGNERELLRTIIRVSHFKEKKSMWVRMTETEMNLEKAMKNSFSNGRISKEEFQKFEIDRASLLARQLQFERQLDEEQTNLERLLKNAETYSKHSFDLRPVPTLDEKAVELIKSWSENLEHFRSGQTLMLKLTELNAESAIIEQNREKGKFLPKLDANASWVTSRFAVQNSGYSAFSPEWTAGISLTIPLFSKLSSTQAIMTALSKSNAELNLADSVRNSELLTKSRALGRLKNSASLSSNMIVVLRSSNDLLKFEESRFLSGRSSVNEFAQNQRRAIDVMDSTYDALELFWLDLQGLCETFGFSMLECLK